MPVWACPSAAVPTPEPYCTKPKVRPLVPGARLEALLIAEEVNETPPAPPPPGPWGAPPPVFEPPLPPWPRMVRFCSTVLAGLPLEALQSTSTEPPAPPPPLASFSGTKAMEAPLTSMVPAVGLIIEARMTTMPPPAAPELAKPLADSPRLAG